MSGIENHLSHDNPMLGTKDRKKSVFWGSGDDVLGCTWRRFLRIELAGETEIPMDW